jgi:ribosomal protein S17
VGLSVRTLVNPSQTARDATVRNTRLYDHDHIAKRAAHDCLFRAHKTTMLAKRSELCQIEACSPLFVSLKNLDFD